MIDNYSIGDVVILEGQVTEEDARPPDDIAVVCGFVIRHPRFGETWVAWPGDLRLASKEEIGDLGISPEDVLAVLEKSADAYSLLDWANEDKDEA